MTKQTNAQTENKEKRYPVWKGFNTYTEIQETFDYRQSAMEIDDDTEQEITEDTEDIKDIKETHFNLYYNSYPNEPIDLNYIGAYLLYKVPNNQGKVISRQCVIHAKIGHLRKAYVNLDTLQHSENPAFQHFAYEYEKYYNSDKKSEFKNAKDVLNYIRKHNVPVIIYNNLSEKEMSDDEMDEYLRMYEDK